MAAEQYNIIGANYASLADLPSEKVATNLLAHKLHDLPRGLRVLDLACGIGTYAQLALNLGVAAEVVGVDISPDMIKTGEALEAKASQGEPRIQFHVADCQEPLDHLKLSPASFDLVMGNYLFNYASCREQLSGMWTNVATYLKPGGKFLGLQPTWNLERHLSRSPWNGMTYDFLGQLEESSKVHVTGHCEPLVEFDNYILPGRDYEEVPREVGMTGVKFHLPTEAQIPSGASVDREAYKAYLSDPVSVLCMATKAPA